MYILNMATVVTDVVRIPIYIATAKPKSFQLLISEILMNIHTYMYMIMYMYVYICAFWSQPWPYLCCLC